MDVFLIVCGVIFVFWWVNNNSSKTTSKTVIRETSEIKTQTGKISIERIHEYEDREISIKDRPKYTPKEPRHYTPLQQPIIMDGTVERIEAESDLAEKKRDDYHRQLKREYNELQARISKILPEKQAPLIVNSTDQNLASQSTKTTKQCPNCRRFLPFSAFRSSSKNIDGLTKWCADCLNTSSKDDMPGHLKLCPKCHQRRLKSSFAKNGKTPDGLAKWCKYCMAGIKR